MIELKKSNNTALYMKIKTDKTVEIDEVMKEKVNTKQTEIINPELN